MHFDEKYVIELEDTMKNIVRKSYLRSSPGSYDNLALDFVSHGNQHAHPVKTHSPDSWRNILLLSCQPHPLCTCGLASHAPPHQQPPVRPPPRIIIISISPLLCTTTHLPNNSLILYKHRLLILLPLTPPHIHPSKSTSQSTPTKVANASICKLHNTLNQY